MSSRAVCDCGWRGPCGPRAAAERDAFQHRVFHWTEESCRASGVPFHVQDPATLKKVAVLLGVRP